jgi:hypothetical protein
MLADIKLVLQREPSSGKSWLPYRSISLNKEHVDVVVRKLHEETGLILTHDDLTMLSDAPVGVALPATFRLRLLGFCPSFLCDDSFTHTSSARVSCYCPVDYSSLWFLRRTGDN